MSFEKGNVTLTEKSLQMHKEHDEWVQKVSRIMKKK